MDMPNLNLYAEITRKSAAQRQIDAAIAHLHKAELECAITLAAATEGMLPDTEKPHIFGYLRQHPLFKEANFNETINWLKHKNGSDAAIIFEFEAAVVIARAMSKFGAVYDEAPDEWHQFLKWGADRGHWPGLPSLANSEPV
jgi:hypothetical protein